MLNKRYDFVFYFDVQDGNPNGDPDAGNLPRIDAETGEGLVTDVCLKRKIRNFMQINGIEIFVKSKDLSGKETFLNAKIREGFEAIGIDLQTEKDVDGKVRKSKGKAQGKEVDKGREFMCKTYYDIRTFGAVLSTGANAGQVRGPVQMTFARSVEPIVALEHTLTVCAARDEEKPFEDQIGIQGRKFTVPYGLYRSHGFVSANFAAQTGFSEEDLTLFWEAMEKMFVEDHSAARGLMSARKLIIFEHETPLGNKAAHELFERVKCERAAEGVARSFRDYKITLDGEPLGEEFKKVVQVKDA